MFYLALITVFILDQVLKTAINFFMLPGQSIPIIKNVLHLTYVQNHGAAFGLFYGQQSFLLLVGIVALALILYLHFNLWSHDFAQLALGFIWGGSLGNFVDRFFKHFVIDYVDFRVFPVFNLADIMINVGVALLIWKLFFKGGRR